MINVNDYDYIVVGAGLSGSVVSRQLSDAGKKVLIVEKRSNIGGNLFDYRNKKNILVQKYGPHTFHTNDDNVIAFVTRFANFKEYHLKCEVKIDNIVTPSPFNFKTIDQFYDEDEAVILKNKLLNKYPSGKATVVEFLVDSDKDISKYANFLFEKDYSLYTSKLWGISPIEVDRSVLK
jgi:UDP-galactopyranose mutase